MRNVPRQAYPAYLFLLTHVTRAYHARPMLHLENAKFEVNADDADRRACLRLILSCHESPRNAKCSQPNFSVLFMPKCAL